VAAQPSSITQATCEDGGGGSFSKQRGYRICTYQRTSTQTNNYTRSSDVETIVDPSGNAIQGVITAGAHHMREFAVVMLLVVATMIDVCGVPLPRKLGAQSAWRHSLLLSLIGLAVLLPAFWVGHAAGVRGRWCAPRLRRPQRRFSLVLQIC